MLMAAIDAYLAIRRAAGYQLRITEGLLRHFARFATARGDPHFTGETTLHP